LAELLYHNAERENINEKDRWKLVFFDEEEFIYKKIDE
jgi:hypothetical protein